MTKFNRRFKNPEHLSLQELIEIQEMIESPVYDDGDIYHHILEMGYEPDNLIQHMKWVKTEREKLTQEERRTLMLDNFYMERARAEKERLRKHGIELPYDVSFDPNKPVQLDLDLGDV